MLKNLTNNKRIKYCICLLVALMLYLFFGQKTVDKTASTNKSVRNTLAAMQGERSCFASKADLVSWFEYISNSIFSDRPLLYDYSPEESRWTYWEKHSQPFAPKEKTGCVYDSYTGLIWAADVEGSSKVIYRNLSAENRDGNIPVYDFLSNTNSNGFCGAKDWRVPTRLELLSVADFEGLEIEKRSRVFISRNGSYWSSTQKVNIWGDPVLSYWQVSIKTGETYSMNPNGGGRVIFVRNSVCNTGGWRFWK